jgi:ATP-dependent helicase HrpA
MDTLKTQNQIRRFCKSHFLSFNRMREWRDIYTQLGEMVEELPGAHWNTQGAGYDAIHRCILTGLWGHIAMRTGKNQYQIQGNKAVTLFPGSSLFDRNAPKKQEKKEPSKAPEPRPSQPPWLVAGEIVETSKVFIRTVAMVDVPWILELGAHLCRYSHTDARWDADSGRVLIRETVTLNGLVVQDQYIGCERVDPKKATEIFIQCALVNGEMESRHAFLEHNRQVIHKLELWQTRVRHHEAIGLFDKIFEFYAQRLEGVSSIHDLNKVVREQQKTNPHFLRMTLEDLTGGPDSGFNAALFPDAVKVGSGSVSVDYAYAPGKENDGATLRVPLELAADIRPGMLDGAVPALREETISFLLQNLPKHLRRVFVPIQEKAAEIATAVGFEPGRFLDNLSLHIRSKFGVSIPASDWALAQLPDHLKPRIEVRGKDAKIIAVSRDAAAIQETIRKEQSRVDTSVLRQLIEKWERYHLSGWTFADMPEQVEAKTPAGLVFRLFPGLHFDEGNVSVRLFKTLDEAHLATTIGFPKLCEKHFNKELAWLQRDLRQLDKSAILYVTLGSSDELRETAWENISRHLFECDPLLPLVKSRFDAVAQSASVRMKDLLPRFCSWIDMILQQRQCLLVCRKPYPTLRQDLDALLPKGFLRTIPFSQLQHVPRYLKAMQLRAERAALNPAKDTERARLVAPYAEAVKILAAKPLKTSRERNWRLEFRWLVEEFKVSCFAQELGTACSISARRLDEFLKNPPA